MKVCVLIKGEPFSWYCHEGLRITLALAMNNEVYLIFLKDGVYALTDWKPQELYIQPFEKIFQLFPSMENLKVLVEEESLRVRGLKKSELKVECEIVNEQRIGELISSSKGVMVW